MSDSVHLLGQMDLLARADGVYPVGRSALVKHQRSGFAPDKLPCTRAQAQLWLDVLWHLAVYGRGGSRADRRDLAGKVLESFIEHGWDVVTPLWLLRACRTWVRADASLSVRESGRERAWEIGLYLWSGRTRESRNAVAVWRRDPGSAPLSGLHPASRPAAALLALRSRSGSFLRAVAPEDTPVALASFARHLTLVQRAVAPIASYLMQLPSPELLVSLIAAPQTVAVAAANASGVPRPWPVPKPDSEFWADPGPRSWTEPAREFLLWQEKFGRELGNALTVDRTRAAQEPSAR